MPTVVLVIASACLSAGSADADRPTANWAEYWERLAASAEARWLAIKATEFQYRLRDLEAYPNGVYATFGVTNLTARDKYLDARFVANPARAPRFVDAGGRA